MLPMLEENGLEHARKCESAVPDVPLSPVELHANLSDARIASAGYGCESRVVDVSARVFKLRMIEDVEKFEAEIERIILMNHGSLQYAEIGVVESGAMEETPVGGSKGPKSRIEIKCAGQEVASRAVGGGAIGIRVARVDNHHWSHPVRHIRGRAVCQRNIIVTLVHLNGKTGGEPRNSLYLPPLCQALGCFSESPVEW